MKRRDVLKLFAFGTAGLSSGLFTFQFLKGTAPGLVVLTHTPTRDVFFLLKHLKEYSDYRISEQAIAPVPQDATLFFNHQLFDPEADETPRWFRMFVRSIRSRPQPARYLISLMPITETEKNTIVIKSDGQLVDVLDVSKNYRDIIIRGPQGNTHLSIQDGKVSVVKASCKHKLCQKQGPVTEGNLICAPNRLIVSLPNQSHLDALIG